MRNVTYELRVEGITWGGFKAEHGYRLAEKDALAINSLEDAKRWAGDFESLNWCMVERGFVVVEHQTVSEFGSHMGMEGS